MAVYLAVPSPPPSEMTALSPHYGDTLADGRRVAKVRALPLDFSLPEGVTNLGESPAEVYGLLADVEEVF